MKTNPRGRLDVLALAVAERLFGEHVEKRIGVKVWPALQPLAEEGVKRGMKHLGIPRKNLLNTPVGKSVEAAFQKTRVSGGCA
jgi:hypothetical protein